MNVFVVRFHTPDSEDVHVFDSGKAAKKTVANYARAYWDEVRGMRNVPDEAPDEDDTAIDLFFGNHPTDDYFLFRAGVNTKEITF